MAALGDCARAIRFVLAVRSAGPPVARQSEPSFSVTVSLLPPLCTVSVTWSPGR